MRPSVRSEDFDLWLRLALAGKRLAFHRGVLGRRRVNSGGLTTDTPELLKSQIRVFRKHRGDPRLSPEARASIDVQIAHFTAELLLEEGKRHLYSRQYPQAHASILQANALLNRPKLKLLLFALRLAPSVTRFVAETVRFLREGRVRRASAGTGGRR